jgi:hypothetical protein
MRSALQQLVETNTTTQRPLKALGLTFEDHNTEITAGGGFGTQTKFCLELRLQCEYWANQAQHSTHRRTATKVIANAIYGDMSKRLDEAMLHMVNENYMEAMHHIGAVIDQMKGGV